MYEAFLLQMNELHDLDRYLESELKLMLNPVVRARVPRRRGGKGGRPLLSIRARNDELAVDSIRLESNRLEVVPLIVEPAVAPGLALIS